VTEAFQSFTSLPQDEKRRSPSPIISGSGLDDPTRFLPCGATNVAIAKQQPIPLAPTR